MIIILISDDHFNSYFYDHMPSFTIGVGGNVRDGAIGRLPEYKIPVQQDLAKHILNTSLENNIDFAFTMRMKVDHGHTQAIYFLNDELEIPSCTDCGEYSCSAFCQQWIVVFN